MVPVFFDGINSAGEIVHRRLEGKARHKQPPWIRGLLPEVLSNNPTHIWRTVDPDRKVSWGGSPGRPLRAAEYCLGELWAQIPPLHSPALSGAAKAPINFLHK